MAISFLTSRITTPTAQQHSGGEPAAELKPSSPAQPPIAAAVQTALCALLILVGWMLRTAPVSTAAFLGAYLAGGIGPVATMLAALRRRQLSVDLLMIVAALGAAYLGDWAEGAVLLFLFSLSGTLENYAFYRTRRSIEALIQLRPQEALRVRDDEEMRVGIASLQLGDLVRVRPGERIPVDGEVIEGETAVDEATLTGESRPVGKTAGSPVFAGTLNGQGSVLVRMTRAVADTTLERIIRMVREAQDEKTPTQRFVESWQQPYVLCVLVGSLLTFLGARLLHTRDWNDAFYHAMVLLVVASPCAVVVGSPAAVLSAIARAARHGVLFKGGYHLELLGRVEIMAFDKTGTVTEGKPGVTAVWTSSGQESDSFLRLTAAVEQRSEHHLAEAVLAEAHHRGLDIPPVQDFESHTGLGVHGRVEGRWVGVGREGLFALHNLAFGVIGFLVLFSFLGLPLWLGVIGHEGSTLLVVLNRLRLLWQKPPLPPSASGMSCLVSPSPELGGV